MSSLGHHALKVVLFSGGRGTSSISQALLEHPQISLTLMVNAYDDGLSTGRLRRFIPGMLGPSDVRKNISRLIASEDESAQALKEVLEYRLPAPTSFKSGMEVLRDVSQLKVPIENEPLSRWLKKISLGQSQQIALMIGRFEIYARDQKAQGIEFDFSDCSVGNLIFSGTYLHEGRDFNRAVNLFSRTCRPDGRILNITSGEGLVLVGLKEDGTLMRNEAEIVSPQSQSAIRDLFLLRDYLSDSEIRELEALTISEKKNRLENLSFYPEINPDCRKVLSEADLIIYGPGTQHSSLFPSYLTQEVSELIAANRDCEKIFVGNIQKDHEIQSETAQTLTNKLFYYLSRRGQIQLDPKNLVTFFFFQSPDPAVVSSRYLEIELDPSNWEGHGIVATNFESHPGEHLGGRVLEQIIRLVNLKAQKKLQSFPYMVSIVVPCLDERRTVKRVLEELSLLDFSNLGLGKEIIFVDGGSKDGSFEIAQTVPGVRCFKLKGETGRGCAIRRGLEQAAGDVAVFFPSDGEYSTADIAPLVLAIVNNGFRAVYGSRAIKCINLTQRIRDIYRGDWVGYWVSKYGGISLSVLGLILLNRFISDCLTGLKAFDANLLHELDLRGKRLEFETELFVKFSKKGVYALELPVDFKPRMKSEGKKTTIWDGIRALFSLVWLSFSWNPKNSPSSFPLTTKKPSSRLSLKRS